VVKGTALLTKAAISGMHGVCNSRLWLTLSLAVLFMSRSDLQRFGKVAKLAAFKPFASAADALEQINAVSEAQLTDDLKNFLTMNLPKVSRGCSWAVRHSSQHSQQQP
jgi:hypothetical protein